MLVSDMLCLPFNTVETSELIIYICRVYEQEVERKARKQFKGLFDKKPGEIAEAQVEDKAGGEIRGENQKNDLSAPLLERDDSQHCNEADGGQYQMGWFYSLWPSGRRIFSALGLDRCTIL